MNPSNKNKLQFLATTTEEILGKTKKSTKNLPQPGVVTMNQNMFNTLQNQNMAQFNANQMSQMQFANNQMMQYNPSLAANPNMLNQNGQQGASMMTK
jgi:hypothetical protein